MRQWSRRRRWAWAGVLILAAVVVALLAPPLIHLVRTIARDRDEREPLAAGLADDASRLNATRIAEVWSIPADRAEAESQLAALLARARREGQGVSIAGARHSMGGHTICPEGIQIDMRPFNHIALDAAAGMLRVGAGAPWSDVIRHLDPRGWSVGVMQSNNSFSVGGSLSVNCHGWACGAPPIASTVQSFRLMLADGTIVTCSRQENPELFRLALGGYGLFGIILEVELRLVPNQRYRMERAIVPAHEFRPTLRDMIDATPPAAMAYGRLSIAPDRFLEEGIINVFYAAPAADGSIPPLHEAATNQLPRAVYRGSAGSEYGKSLRWQAEKAMDENLGGDFFARNQLLNSGVAIFENRTAATTDILHEYFIPPSNFEAFLERLRVIIPSSGCDLLNVTVRDVRQDHDTMLRYADRDMLALVMLFVQPRTPRGEAQMQALGQRLIDAALELEGRHYLPYRLHGDDEQFRRACPQADEFFDRKRGYDPGELFQNQFYHRYGRSAAGARAAGGD